MKRILPANSVLVAIAINFGFASIPIITSPSRDSSEEDAFAKGGGPNAAIGAPIRLYSTVRSSAPLIATPNDNRVPAGRLDDDVLAIRLDAREGVWFPEGRNERAVPAYVFRTGRRAPQIPGPLIRVRAGTRIRALVHNGLPETLTLRGLQDRGATSLDTFIVAPGETREIRFRAKTPGRFYYWGRTDTTRDNRGGVSDSQLVGAFIVDPAQAPQDPTERIMVLTQWDDMDRMIPGRRLTEMYAVNGYMWPYTERVDTARDSTVWRVINASRTPHRVRILADTVLGRWRAIAAR